LLLVFHPPTFRLIPKRFAAGEQTLDAFQRFAFSRKGKESFSFQVQQVLF
jgi:hypothetical protein